MAVARAFLPLDMENQAVWFGSFGPNSDMSTTIELVLGDRRTVYEGDFTFSFLTGLKGTLDSVREYKAGALLYEITEINGDAAAFYSAIQLQGNWSLAATIALSGRDRLFGSSGDDVAFGWTGNDRIRGGAGNDRLAGDDGNDVIFGDAGNDHLIGDYAILNQTGNDKLFGLSGNDRLDGGNGDDELSGGRGRDTFVFSNGDDIVTDFSGRDFIDLTGVAAITGFRDLKNNHATQIGDDLLITDGTSNTMLLLDTQLSDLRQNDFLF